MVNTIYSERDGVFMKILLLTDEVWNDKIYTNNILTNWFEGMSVKFANIYLASGLPDNKCCNTYFQITDKMMLKSLISNKKAGISFNQDELQEPLIPEEAEHFYSFLKSAAAETLRLIKDFIWTNGNYDKDKLSKFIDDFNPDLIFSLRSTSRKMLRFEQDIVKQSQKPLIVFTSSDEELLKQFSMSPVYWYRHSKLQKAFKKTLPLYQKYYTLSANQAADYKNQYKIHTDVLTKCMNIKDNFSMKVVHYPVKLIYAGSLNHNKWKTLEDVYKALNEINKKRLRMIMEIYPMEKVSDYRRRQIEDGIQSFIKTPAADEELKEVYKNADIALYLEAFDSKSRIFTKYSFSNGILDCLSSGCSVLAVCPRESEGYGYLKGQDAAICISSPKRIYPVLKKLFLHHEKIYEYQKKAWYCGVDNHDKLNLQQKLLEEFSNVIVGTAKS